MYALYILAEDLTENEIERSTGFYTDRRQNIFRVEDAIGNVFFMEYEDPLNPRLMTSRTTPSGTTEFTYNDQGNLREITDPQGNVTLYEYSEDVDQAPINPFHRNLLRKVHRPQVTVPDGQGGTTLVQYNPTEFLYDSLGNLVELVDAEGNSTLFDIRSDGQIASVTDRRGFTTLFRYNDDLMETDRGLLREIETPGDGNDNPAKVTTLRYDPVYDDVIEMEDPLGNVWETAYDPLDRPLTVTDARGKATGFSYLDGLLEEIELPANEGSSSATRKTNFQYDDLGRLLEVHSDIDGRSQQLRARFEYSSFSDLKKLTRLMDEVEKHTEYDHDLLGRVTRARDPLHSTQNPRETLLEHSLYCAETTVTTARGKIRRSNFDSRCQLTLVSSPYESHEMEYDELGRLISLTQSHESRYGTMQEVDPLYGQSRFGSSSAVRKFEYDELDRLVKITFEDDSTLLYEHDEESNLLQATDTAGNVTEYTYYKDNRLKQVILKRSGQDDRVFTYRYDEAGRLKTLEYPTDTGIIANFGYLDGQTWVHGWNENGQLTYVDYRKNGSSVQKFQYAYDDSGNRKQLTDTPAAGADQVVWDYSYDRLNRLSSVTRSMPQANPSVAEVVTSYLFDESDNRIQVDYTVGEDPTVSTTYVYNLADEITERWVDQVLTETFVHDKDGNMVSRVLDPGGAEVTTNYKFDEWDRLVCIETKSDGTVLSRQRSRYDSGNIRKSKTTKGGPTTTFRYSGMTVANETVSGQSPTTTSFFSGHQVVGFEREGDFYYFITDGLSSVRLVVDEDGDVVASYDADEFGNSILVDENGASTDQRWVGGLGYKDEVGATGLYYMRQRWYAPELGRFLSRDALGGRNRYEYSYNSPVNWLDADGLQPTLTIYSSYEHSWIGIDYGNGSKSKVVGLFPEGLVFGDKDNRPESATDPVVKYTATLTNKQLSDLEKFIGTNADHHWSFSYNCTDFAVEAWKVAGQPRLGKPIFEMHGPDPLLWRPHFMTKHWSSWLTILPRFGVDLPSDLYNAIQDTNSCQTAQRAFEKRVRESQIRNNVPDAINPMAQPKAPTIRYTY